MAILRFGQMNQLGIAKIGQMDWLSTKEGNDSKVTGKLVFGKKSDVTNVGQRKKEIDFNQSIR